ncbi:MAG: dipeptidase [Candidatus Marinimicrobia bacterium]|nr:dipeptidase [Candidatus Neomarinimicrobiota bacterium]MCF7830303.1 dipeptidase [Candidatus Neomarinimicrobiota bacterium]
MGNPTQDKIHSLEKSRVAAVIRIPFILLLLTGILSCQGENTQMTTADLHNRADSIAQKSLLIDTHIDAPYHLYHSGVDWTAETDRHFDYPKAVRGGLNSTFMAIYIPPKYQAGGAKEYADTLITKVREQVENHPEKFILAFSPGEVEKQFSRERISLALGMENGAPIEGDLANLQHFYDRGIRYITLTHSEDNHICDSSYDTTETWGGLSPFGKRLVPAMNRIGMMIDVSHVTDSTFYQAIELSKAPVVATHSGCRHFTPGFHRNMSDDAIKVLAEHNGVIQINFGSYFVSETFREERQNINDHLDAYYAEHGLEEESDEARDYAKKYRKEHPVKDALLTDVADHIDHVVDLVGIDYVGLGSDFDGVGSVPTRLENVSKYPNLIAELLRRGYSEEDIRKIAGGNFLRVWREVESVAVELQSD